MICESEEGVRKRAGLRRPHITLWVLLGCFVAATCVSAISLEPESVKVQVQDEMAGLWVVHEASIQENNIGMDTVLEIENVSAVATVDAAFYGEYFDGLDRFCFAALFAQDENNEGRTGAFLPGAVRHLRSGTFYIHPVSRPVRLKLHILSDPREDDQGKIRGGAGVLGAATAAA